MPNGEQRYYPFGESRITTASLPTDRLFTGQRAIGEFSIGLYHCGARVYEPYHNRSGSHKGVYYVVFIFDSHSNNIHKPLFLGIELGLT